MNDFLERPLPTHRGVATRLRHTDCLPDRPRRGCTNAELAETPAAHAH